MPMKILIKSILIKKKKITDNYAKQVPQEDSNKATSSECMKSAPKKDLDSDEDHLSSHSSPSQIVSKPENLILKDFNHDFAVLGKERKNKDRKHVRSNWKSKVEAENKDIAEIKNSKTLEIVSEENMQRFLKARKGENAISKKLDLYNDIQLMIKEGRDESFAIETNYNSHERLDGGKEKIKGGEMKLVRSWTKLKRTLERTALETIEKKNGPAIDMILHSSILPPIKEVGSGGDIVDDKGVKAKKDGKKGNANEKFNKKIHDKKNWIIDSYAKWVSKEDSDKGTSSENVKSASKKALHINEENLLGHSSSSQIVISELKNSEKTNTCKESNRANDVHIVSSEGRDEVSAAKPSCFVELENDRKDPIHHELEKRLKKGSSLTRFLSVNSSEIVPETNEGNSCDGTFYDLQSMMGRMNSLGNGLLLLDSQNSKNATTTNNSNTKPTNCDSQNQGFGAVCRSCYKEMKKQTKDPSTDFAAPEFQEIRCSFEIPSQNQVLEKMMSGPEVEEVMANIKNIVREQKCGVTATKIECTFQESKNQKDISGKSNRKWRCWRMRQAHSKKDREEKNI
mmetsp:Transcript_40598/g.95334  ORF Transcript_40598/g.95334 Transcript_40598/m.95334 type:complete len:569 (-) Transcript_40598:251-1957(-)